MVKEQLIHLCLDILGLRFGDRTLALHIENAWNTVVGQTFRKDCQQFDFYSKPYEVDVVHGNRPYSILPESIIQTIDHANGVRRITPLDSNKFDFVPIPSIALLAFDAVDLGDVTDSIGYYVKHDKVEYWNMPSYIKKVRMELVIPFSKWDDLDDIPLPDGTAEQIVQMACLSYRGGNVQTDIHTKSEQ